MGTLVPPCLPPKWVGRGSSKGVSVYPGGYIGVAVWMIVRLDEQIVGGGAFIS